MFTGRKPYVFFVQLSRLLYPETREHRVGVFYILSLFLSLFGSDWYFSCTLREVVGVVAAARVGIVYEVEE